MVVEVSKSIRGALGLWLKKASALSDYGSIEVERHSRS
jgi:hypothetical protein